MVLTLCVEAGNRGDDDWMGSRIYHSSHKSMGFFLENGGIFER